MKFLIKSEVLFIKRFSLKIVAELCRLVKALEQIASYVNEIMLDYSSSILQRIMNDPKMCVLLQNNQRFIDRVVDLINSTKDVDVYCNGLQVSLYFFFFTFSKLV